MSDQIRNKIKESVKVAEASASDDLLTAGVEKAVKLCVEALKGGKKILFAGNGGSAADAQHLAAELVNRFGFDRPAIPAVALTTDTSVITSISNDYGFQRVFSRQVEAIGNKGDILVVLSTSGTSPSITEAVSAAKKAGLITIALTGRTGGNLNGTCDLVLKVPSESTPRIQEIHIIIGHIICSEIENSLFK